ncbi:TPA: hypothetical protein I4G64_04710 [Enterobacter cloacae]|nr:hypothetical protein [Enterobacter pasteurii]
MFPRHSLNDGNVIGVETVFQYSEVSGIFDVFPRGCRRRWREGGRRLSEAKHGYSHGRWLTTKSDSRSTDVPFRHSDNSYFLV